jgi:hypothetical protein
MLFFSIWHSLCFITDRNELNAMYQTETKTQNESAFGRTLACLSVACLFAITAAANATTDSANEVFVDSVYSWGIWELGLDPESGPQPPSGNALNDRSRSLKFRPNDNAAYMVRSIPVAPAVSVAPAAPSVPSTPLTPVTPMPIGPPGFSTGAATTADPRN